ncbi:MAG: hypothetical protein KJZ86_06140 [Caldilineaceae bacterium]|nr:hypothetical protein [Caldilineaceae bacterium]
MSRLRSLSLLLLLALAGIVPTALAAGDGKPTLVIPSRSVRGDETAQVEVLFAGSGHAINAVTFAVEYDAALLTPQLAQAAFSLPAGFSGSAKASPYAPNKIDVAIFTLSSHSLPDGPVLALPFQPLCPENAEWLETDVIFSVRPRATFGNVQGVDIPGETMDGHLSIWCRPDPLPTPTPTPTPSPTPALALFELDAQPAPDEEVPAGEVIGYSLAVEARGGQPLTGVEVGVDTPPGMTVEALSFNLQRPGRTADLRLHWTLDALLPGEKLRVEMALRPDPALRGPLTVTATLTSDQTGTLQTQRVVQVGSGPGGTDGGQRTLFLPVISQAAGAGGVSPARLPDLTIEAIEVVEGHPVVVVANRGDSPVVNGFWVDLYVDPQSPPVGVNQLWHELSTQGAAWGVDTPLLPLLPGASLRLGLDSPAFSALHSHLEGDLTGLALYAQGDSWNPATTYGAVAERDEAPGGVYNNIAGPEVSHGPRRGESAISPESIPAGDALFPPPPVRPVGG